MTATEMSALNLPACLAAENVTVKFGGLTALSDISLSFAPGKGIDAVIGPNGAGKTTLFNVLTGVIAPTHGMVFARGQDMTRKRLDYIFRNGISRTFQGVRLFDHLTVEQNVAVAALATTGREERLQGKLLPAWGETSKSRLRVAQALDRVGLSSAVRNVMPPQLTLWERRMVEIARAISSEPFVLLVDEPAAGLNPVEKTRLRELLTTLSADLDCRVVVVEHDMAFVMSIAQRVTVLNFGKLLASGTPAAIQADPLVHEAYLGRPREAVA